VKRRENLCGETSDYVSAGVNLGSLEAKAARHLSGREGATCL